MIKFRAASFELSRDWLYYAFALLLSIGWWILFYLWPYTRFLLLGDRIFDTYYKADLSFLYMVVSGLLIAYLFRKSILGGQSYVISSLCLPVLGGFLYGVLMYLFGGVLDPNPSFAGLKHTKTLGSIIIAIPFIPLVASAQSVVGVGFAYLAGFFFIIPAGFISQFVLSKCSNAPIVGPGLFGVILGTVLAVTILPDLTILNFVVAGVLLIFIMAIAAAIRWRLFRQKSSNFRRFGPALPLAVGLLLSCSGYYAVRSFFEPALARNYCNIIISEINSDRKLNNVRPMPSELKLGIVRSALQPALLRYQGGCNFHPDSNEYTMKFQYGLFASSLDYNSKTERWNVNR